MFREADPVLINNMQISTALKCDQLGFFFSKKLRNCSKRYSNANIYDEKNTIAAILMIFFAYVSEHYQEKKYEKNVHKKNTNSFFYNSIFIPYLFCEIYTAHWIKKFLRRTSEHNHKYNYLNLSFFTKKSIFN